MCWWIQFVEDFCVKTSQVAQWLRIWLPMREMKGMQIQSWYQKDPLENGMTTNSSILACEIPWTEETGRLQSMGVSKSWTGLSDRCSTLQFSSVAQLCPTLCNSTDCTTPGLPVHHQFPEFTQAPVHWVGDTIQPFVFLFSSHLQSFPASGSFSMSQLFQWAGQNIGASASASVLPMNTKDWSPLDGLVGSPCSPRDSQVSFPTPQFKTTNSSVLSFLYGPTLTSIHDHWKNHNFDQTDLFWQSNVSTF